MELVCKNIGPHDDQDGSDFRAPHNHNLAVTR